MITEEDDQRRQWANMCPDLLNSIYKRLPSHVYRTQFGGVCKNWHQIHSHGALSDPLPMEINRTKFTRYDVIQVQGNSVLFDQRYCESEIPSGFVAAGGENITIIGRAGAWLLLKRGNFFSWYNPLLRSPANYIRLPASSFHFSNYYGDPTKSLPVSVAFSALPTARDSMILAVYGDRYFSTTHCDGDDWEWETYDFSLPRKQRQICLGVGYRKGRFFCLFEMGDILIVSANRRNGTRILLAAIKPLLPEQLERWDSLRVVAMMAKKSAAADDRYHDEVREMMRITVVSHWERHHKATDKKDSFRLVAVEENAVSTATDLLLENEDYDDMVLLEEGENRNSSRGVILVKDQLPLKENFDGLYNFWLNMVAMIVVFAAGSYLLFLFIGLFIC